MSQATTSGLIFAQNDLDRTRVGAIVDEALVGSDDGELFLEYRADRELRARRRPAEERRLRHLPGLRPAPRGRRGDRLRPRHRADRGGASAAPPPPSRAVEPGHSGDAGRAARRHQPPPLHRRQSDRDRAVRRQDRAPAGASTPTPAAAIRACARSSPRSPATGRWSRSCAPAASAPPTSGRWCASTSRWSSRRRRPHGERHLRPRRPRRLRRAASTPRRGRRAVDEALRQALVNLRIGPGAGRRDDRWCSGRAGRASCCTRRSATASKATSTARRPRPSPA